MEVFNQLKEMKMMNTEEFENAMNEGRIERYHCLWVLAEVKRLRRLNDYLWEHRSSHWSADDDAEMDRLEMME